jgi:hypothetical protein
MSRHRELNFNGIPRELGCSTDEAKATSFAHCASAAIASYEPACNERLRTGVNGHFVIRLIEF